jgi:hypothetical protein
MGGSLNGSCDTLCVTRSQGPLNARPAELAQILAPVALDLGSGRDPCVADVARREDSAASLSPQSHRREAKFSRGIGKRHDLVETVMVHRHGVYEPA